MTLLSPSPQHLSLPLELLSLLPSLPHSPFLSLPPSHIPGFIIFISWSTSAKQLMDTVSDAWIKSHVGTCLISPRTYISLLFPIQLYVYGVPRSNYDFRDGE